ncbi:hypothetical protein BDV95DRAFT_562768 [Massariosphaeria phaeospora]|uniref:Uncharacterized protein n=1 Tax=Massariosphaeria phaeospora TaxID=100035 RepID=A0A7C8MDW2_9PLEO|nr:hypothetical protein BDV95DRAFT_562768 [Massariosphaeria phaeospora]
MVKISLIRQSNSRIDESSAPRVAVFAGGTSGIGKLTLAELAGLGTSFKAYVVGRKESERSFKTFIGDLHQTNPNAEIIWVEGEISLLSEVKRICDHIKTLESRIDLFFLTAGYAPFEGRKNTPEGLDVSHSLSFYSRICFIENLLPLLRASETARVVSVHSGGFEYANALNVNDLNLEQPGAFGPMITQLHMGIMGTLTLERLAEAEENQSVVFIHSHPGIVRTGNLFRGWGEGWWGPWFAAIFMDPILMLLAFSLKESAERYLYQVTSGAIGGKGPTLPGIVGRTTRGEPSGGLFLVSKKCDTVKNEKQLAKLRVTAQDAVWAKVRQIITPYV